MSTILELAERLERSAAEGEKLIGEILASIEAMQARADARLTALHAAIDAAHPRAEDVAPVADAGGWIAHHGGKCPVAERTIVRVRFRDGMEAIALAGLLRWWRDGTRGDIVAYRLGC